MQHVLDGGTDEEQDAAEEQRHRDEVELEGGGDPEPALAAADRPEQLRVTRGGHRPDRPVGGDQLDRTRVVGREPVPACEVCFQTGAVRARGCALLGRFDHVCLTTAWGVESVGRAVRRLIAHQSLE